MLTELSPLAKRSLPAETRPTQMDAVTDSKNLRSFTESAVSLGPSRFFLPRLCHAPLPYEGPELGLVWGFAQGPPCSWAVRSHHPELATHCLSGFVSLI